MTKVTNPTPEDRTARYIGDNWDQTGRIELPLSMGPRLSPEAKARLDELDNLNVAALIAACNFPLGATFSYHDEPGEHDPAYVVMPDGSMLPVNHYNDGDAPIPTDVARAAFMVTACNKALSEVCSAFRTDASTDPSHD